MTKTANRVGSRPERQPPWRRADDDRLVERYHAGDTLAQLCATLARSLASVENRVLVLRRRHRLPQEAWQVLRRRGDVPARSQPAPRQVADPAPTAAPADPLADVMGPERPARLWLRAMRNLRARNAAPTEHYA